MHHYVHQNLLMIWNLLKAMPRRMAGRLSRTSRSALERTRVIFLPTYTQAAGVTVLAQRFDFLDCEFLERLQADSPIYADLIRQQAGQTMSHCFDLLGSGPVVVAYGVTCAGFEGHLYRPSMMVVPDPTGGWLTGRINGKNLDEARRIWALVDVEYIPIDWQLDFKSGYRWRENHWHRDIRFGNLAGVDVKVPWELARLQHLPTLALACHFARTGTVGFASTRSYERELRNQILDFVATNPPGFGVNWVCAMDVAIRAVNMLVARDLATAAGVRFDDAFEAIFAASVLAHARYVASNLEWTSQYRGNHYLANIVGLLFIGAYLPGCGEVDAWLTFAVQELLVEVGHQFHADGSNFEASVCYHRLSSEMVMWAFALLAGLPPEKLSVLQTSHTRRSLPRLREQPLALYAVPWGDQESPVPEWCWRRLARMADFTEAMTRPDGLAVQFGDNDSGRFITLGSGEQLRAANDPASPLWSLDHGSLITAIRALLGGANNIATASDPVARIVIALAGGCGGCDGRESPLAAVGGLPEWAAASARFAAAQSTSRWTVHFPASVGLLDGLKLVGFPGMGCYVFRSRRLYLAIRCGEIGLNGLGAHAHCDQLAIELVVDGKTLVRDPGTMVYTPAPAIRNSYRSVKAHHAPRVAGLEPADLSRHIFDLSSAAAGECLYFGASGFVGRHAGFGAHVYRMIALEDDGVLIHDFSDGNLVLVDPTPEPLPFSPSYGRRDHAMVSRL